MHASTEGYLRMTLKEVLSLRFTHLFSGLDESCDSDRCGSRTTITGYTEWLAGNPPITIGWDWMVTAQRWVRVGSPRSNVLLVDPTERSYSRATSEAVLGTIVDTIAWQEQARCAVYNRYA